MTVDELQKFAPSVDWRAFLDASGLSAVQAVVITETTAVQKIAQIVADTPLDTLKAWEAFHFVDGASPYLSKRFVDSQFEFDGKALSGTPAQRPRWKRGVSLIDDRLGEAVGQEYVAKYFPPASKGKMDALVANLKTAMAARIRTANWMSAQTKEQALEKLSKMEVMVGYPSKWRDYSKLKIDPADLYGNLARSIVFETVYQFAKIGKPVDKAEWSMTPQTVDAYNGGLENKIVFPAGILQPPFFNPDADPAVNYGAIGAVIGHESRTGSTIRGARSMRPARCATGGRQTMRSGSWRRARSWRRRSPREGVPGTHINGNLTLGENIADLGGLLVAIDAYHASLGGKPAPIIDGLTGDQRLFLGYAQSWRGKARDDALRAQMASDPHSPRKFRVIGATRNVDSWYQSFDVTAGQKYS